VSNPIGFTWTVDVDEDGARHLHGELLATASDEHRQMFAKLEAYAIHLFGKFYADRQGVRIPPPDPKAGLN
jgi:hypothetical protein